MCGRYASTKKRRSAMLTTDIMNLKLLDLCNALPDEYKITANKWNIEYNYLHDAGIDPYSIEPYTDFPGGRLHYRLDKSIMIQFCVYLLRVFSQGSDNAAAAY